MYRHVRKQWERIEKEKKEEEEEEESNEEDEYADFAGKDPFYFPSFLPQPNNETKSIQRTNNQRRK